MRNFTVFTVFIVCFFTSCNEDSVSDEFNSVNEDVQEKLIKSISVISNQEIEESRNISLSYTPDRKLNTITDGDETTFFEYENNELSSIKGSGNESLNIEDLYQSPYDAFETGEVLNYDNNGNPTKIEFYEYDYNYDTDNEFIRVYTADISYDNKPNPYYYTLNSGGIIDVLDNVRLNISTNPQLEEIINARMLFPLNNPSQIIYKDDNNQTVFTVNVIYNYNSYNYPISAQVTSVSFENSVQTTYSAIFQYLD